MIYLLHGFGSRRADFDGVGQFDASRLLHRESKGTHAAERIESPQPPGVGVIFELSLPQVLVYFIIFEADTTDGYKVRVLTLE